MDQIVHLNNQKTSVTKVYLFCDHCEYSWQMSDVFACGVKGKYMTKDERKVFLKAQAEGKADHTPKAAVPIGAGLGAVGGNAATAR
jgi:hypothetical protein